MEDSAADRWAARHAPTVAGLADRHIEEHAKVKNTPHGAKRVCQLWDRNILPKLGKRKVADFWRADVAKLIDDGDVPHPRSGQQRALSPLSRSFNCAETFRATVYPGETTVGEGSTSSPVVPQLPKIADRVPRGELGELEDAWWPTPRFARS